MTFRNALVIISAAASLCCARKPEIPPAPTTHLTDLAHVLSPKMAFDLNAELEAYEVRTKHQVVVWISDKAWPNQMTKEEFCLRAMNAWGVGREGYDDGVVWFIFPVTTPVMRTPFLAEKGRLHMRIQVGYGLERVLPDRECVQILREVAGPPLEAGLWDEGVYKGVRAILNGIDGEVK